MREVDLARCVWTVRLELSMQFTPSHKMVLLATPPSQGSGTQGKTYAKTMTDASFDLSKISGDISEPGLQGRRAWLRVSSHLSWVLLLQKKQSTNRQWQTTPFWKFTEAHISASFFLCLFSNRRCQKLCHKLCQIYFKLQRSIMQMCMSQTQERRHWDSFFSWLYNSQFDLRRRGPDEICARFLTLAREVATLPSFLLCRVRKKWRKTWRLWWSEPLSSSHVFLFSIPFCFAEHDSFLLTLRMVSRRRS